MTRNRALFVALVLAAAVLPVLGQDDGDGPRSVQAGVYSTEQAARGEKLFGERCLVCHQPEEFGAGVYLEGWSGQTADAFLELIRATMPEDNPGSLERREYADIIAYLFQLNGLPAGEAEMEASSLRNVKIEGPYSSGKGK